MAKSLLDQISSALGELEKTGRILRRADDLATELIDTEPNEDDDDDDAETDTD